MRPFPLFTIQTQNRHTMSTPTQHTPRSVEVSHTCDCGRTYSARIYHAVNITLEPALLYTLLSGRLNVASCPNCGRKAASPLPFLYHDMKRGLFAYVHPNADLDDEGRDQVVQRLQRVYTQAVQDSQRIAAGPSRPPSPTSAEHDEWDVLAGGYGMIDPSTPPMQVMFGIEGLTTLVDSLLEPDERLGHIALHSSSQNPAERARFLQVAEQLAVQSGCQLAQEEHDGTLSVEIYGSRARVGRLVSALHSSA
jgi:CpXC protein